jgi:zinc and cadmium transporter
MYSIAAALLVSAVSLVGAAAVWLPKKWLDRSLTFLVSLAVGVLLGDAFIHLLPDALAETRQPVAVMLLALAGILLFFVLEKFVKWRHHHGLSREGFAPGGGQIGGQAVRPFARMNLIGDAVHNFIDGTIIASSFLVSPTVGLATTAAIIAHEIPQEVGDVGALVSGGYAPRRAARLNFLCSLTALAGALVTLACGLLVGQYVVWLLPLAAGGFIYIAASDLIPELHAETVVRRQFGQAAMIGVGMSAMLLVIAFERLMR